MEILGTDIATQPLPRSDYIRSRLESAGWLPVKSKSEYIYVYEHPLRDVIVCCRVYRSEAWTGAEDVCSGIKKFIATRGLNE